MRSADSEPHHRIALVQTPAQRCPQVVPFQFERGGTWTKGKSADTFAPIGPYLVTADEVPDPHALDLFLEVNGECMQNGSTRNFIFNVFQVVSYISHFMTLMPGDVIPTGTPAGVGFGKKPQRFLKEITKGKSYTDWPAALAAQPLRLAWA